MTRALERRRRRCYNRRVRGAARRLLFVALIASVLAGAGRADATIVPQRGIAGAELFMTKPEVRGVLGAPDEILYSSSPFGRVTEFRYPGLKVFFLRHSGAVAITTTRRTETTPAGAGVGSTRRELRTAHPAVRCRVEFGVDHCWLGRFLPGRKVTDFRIRDGEVTRVTVAVVVD